jgi:predicted N-acetyltransferase YhbS
MKINIDYIHRHREAVDTIVDWHLAQWGKILADFTPLEYSQYLVTHNRMGGIPSFFVAAVKGQVVGTVALEANDMALHPELSPWLARLYVVENYRKKGVGRALIKRAVKEAGFNNVKRLYTFTPGHIRLYEHLGWQTIAREKYHGENVTVMVYNI